MTNRANVRVWTEKLVIPTYLPEAPDKNPMFLERRVYQGSNGKVYPLPFTDRIAEQPTPRAWQAVWIENEYLRVLILPEIGGRIHAIEDKISGTELIYRQPVIKPALVGLAGPWISGGIEFNWSQHHRPATFLPADFEVEENADGSQTVWCGDHDPMSRMKGMHGICLHPGKAYVELKARAQNRTGFVQTFLWWANVGLKVHEGYQSFFPPDVYYVADHAKRATSRYPLAEGLYYGVNYGERGRNGVPKAEVPRQYVPPHCLKDGGKDGGLRYRPNDLSFYANIPTPCSYMCMGTKEDFFGGYDHFSGVGLVHVANHHIAPGKKQWTWGNHEFGYAWDRNLTDADAKGEFAPYIELMAGVYTDNQPDFSFLQPGETRTWSQYWYPIRQVGPVQQANLQAAVSLRIEGKANRKMARVAVAVTEPHKKTVVLVSAKGRKIAKYSAELSPAKPLVRTVKLPSGAAETDLTVTVADGGGRVLVSYQPSKPVATEVPPPATEPSAPGKVSSVDELYVIGLHLEQYRHATRCPTLYWKEALRRDAGDSRCNNTMGRWHLRRGEFAEAEVYLRRAIERLTSRNPNPYDGEPYYNLGLCLAFQERHGEAYDAFYKATWNQAWQGAAFHALAELDCRSRNWSQALDHLDLALRSNSLNARASNLKAMVLRKLRRTDEADAVLQATLRLDPLDGWARYLYCGQTARDTQALLDLAYDLARAGLRAEAIQLLKMRSGKPLRRQDLPDQGWGAEPMVDYTLGWLYQQEGETREARRCFARASQQSPDYCFPSRLEEIAVLECVLREHPKDARAPYYLGNLYYDRRRHQDAIRLWERSVRLDAGYSVAWRNLGIAYFNVAQQPAKALKAYEQAVRTNPADARLFYERDQLWKRLGHAPAKRLAMMQSRPDLIARRDDLSVEYCTLLNQTGQPAKALESLLSRHFQPWEGGEGLVLGQYVRSHLSLGQRALTAGDADEARRHFEAALTVPASLGEARHILANQSDIHYWLGAACQAQGDKVAAGKHWEAAANFKGDFQEMSVRAFSEMTYYTALSQEKLGKKSAARKLLRELLAFGENLKSETAKIDYFATSLPTMLLFEDDLQARQETAAQFLQAQAFLGLGETARAKALLKTVLQRDPNHALAKDLL
jgi:tetratricopeptide (TPR) repeat protein